MSESTAAMERTSEAERSQVRAQEYMAMALALAGAGLAATVSPWWLLMAVFFALGHWMLVDESERVGVAETTLERAQRSVEVLIAAGVNERFDAEGVPASHRAARFEIRSLKLRRDGEDGLTAHAGVEREDGARYEVIAAIPPSGVEREPGVEVRSVRTPGSDGSTTPA